MAELGFVGDGPNTYQVWLGGNPAQTAMAAEYKDRVKVRFPSRGQSFVLACLSNLPFFGSTACAHSLRGCV